MKKLKFFTLSFLFLSITFSSFAQKNKLLHFETNKVLCLYSFLETATNAPGSSSSYREYIDNELKNELAFKEIQLRFSALNLKGDLKKEGYPFSRHSSKTVRDLLWIASSNSLNINDLSDRITGLISNHDQAELIDILKKAEPFYDKIVWDKVQDKIARIENQLEPYGERIEALFLKISKFYGTDWNTNIPFKVMLYPIPLTNGVTTAIPKGNALICSFLTEREDDYIGRLGVIIHEMCHILYDEQPLKLQNKVDGWFTESKSDFSKLAYSYIDEGLATAIGNGWAYREIHGEIDQMEWYNNIYINGFGHALFDDVSNYLSQGKTMDEAFVKQAISLFGKTFPKSNSKVATLLNEVRIYSSEEEEKEVDLIFENLHNNFQIRSAWFSSPVEDPKSIESFHEKTVTKLFIITKNNSATLDLIKKEFGLLHEFPSYENFIFSSKHQPSRSPIIILNLKTLNNLDTILKDLKEMEYLDFEKIIKIKGK
ncbi:MAG: hypothetical protein AB8F94_27840 [Saprospiraceae bacterium]